MARRRLPQFASQIAEPLLDSLGELAPARDRQRILGVLSSVETVEVASIGLEVVLPPHPPACDLSLLLPPGVIPSFIGAGVSPLVDFVHRLDSGTVWWEHDTSLAVPSSGAFLRVGPGIDGFAAAVAATFDLPHLVHAIGVLQDTVGASIEKPGALLGFFPDRAPSPMAAALIPTPIGELPEAGERLRALVHAGPEFDQPLVEYLAGTCDQSALAVAVTGEGEVAMAAEFSFASPERALKDGAWRECLTGFDGWGPGGAVIPHLLALEGVHRFDAIPPVIVLTGIDHLKVGPYGRIKAYVGASISVLSA